MHIYKESSEMDQRKRSLITSFLIGFVILVGLDQWTKGLVVKYLKEIGRAHV